MSEVLEEPSSPLQVQYHLFIIMLFINGRLVGWGKEYLLHVQHERPPLLQ